jgi:hypothetical protein
VTDPQTPLSTEELDAHERRLQAEFEDARRTLNIARSNFDRIANELRELRVTRREAAAHPAIAPLTEES